MKQSICKIRECIYYLHYHCFADTAIDYMNDKKAIKVIEGLIDSLKNTTELAIEMPLILNVTPIEADKISTYAEEYFQNNDLIRFSALFSSLDKTAQNDYCQKLYNDDNIALFSTILKDLDYDTILQYVDKSEQDDKISFYSVVMNHVQPSDLQRYAERSYNTNHIARFSILVQSMTKEEIQEWLVKAQADKKSSFISVLSHRLND